MGITLNSSSLPGIQVRQSIGAYIIDATQFLDEASDGDGNIISRSFNFLKGVAGFLWKAAVGLLSVLNFTFTRLWGLIINTTQFIWNFDFGASDESLNAQINSYWQVIAGQAGGLIGQSLGWLFCGALPGVVMLKFNKIAALNVLREVGDEALDELSAAVYGLCNSSTQMLTRALIIKSYQAVRRWLRKPGNIFYALVPESLKKAWAEGKSWRIADRVDQAIESIKNVALQNFVEEMLEEFADACIEAGYVVAGGLDAYVAQNRRGAVENVVEITPNREYENEKIILAGPEDELRSLIPAAISQYQLIDQRDIGVISTIEASQLYTQAMPLELYVKLEWRTPQGNQGPRPCYQVSSVKRSKISDYDFIRQIMGGGNGYLWGRYKATASMSDGHFITCYGGTESAAEERALALATLSDADVHLIQVAEERKTQKRLTIKGLQKEATQVFPYRIVIVNRKYFDTPRPNSRASKRGYYVPIEARLSISSPTKPLDWDETIQRILLGPTASNPG